MGLGALHDELLASMPEGASHDTESCQWCSDPELAEVINGGDMSDATFTQEDLDAAVSQAVDAATQSLKDQVADLRTDQEKAAVEARIAEVRAELEAEVEAANAALAEVESKATAAEQAHADVVAWLAGEKESAERAAELATRAEERKAAVKEIASFSDEYLDANASKWAEWADDDFDTFVDGLKSAAEATREAAAAAALEAEEAAKREKGNSLIPETAMSAERSGETDPSKAAIRSVLALGRVAPDLANL